MWKCWYKSEEFRNYLWKLCVGLRYWFRETKYELQHFEPGAKCMFWLKLEWMNSAYFYKLESNVKQAGSSQHYSMEQERLFTQILDGLTKFFIQFTVYTVTIVYWNYCSNFLRLSAFLGPLSNYQDRVKGIFQKMFF